MTLSPALCEIDAPVVAKTVEGAVATLRVAMPEPWLAAARGAGRFVLARSLRPGAPPLPRALSVIDTDGDLLLGFNIIGPGTQRLAETFLGEAIMIVGPFGNTFSVPDGPLTLLAKGSHAGTMLALAVERAARQPVTVLLEGEGATADWLARAFEASGVALRRIDAVRRALEAADPAWLAVGTEDDSALTAQTFAAERGVPGEVALQAPMACGIGVCAGCVRRFTDGLRLVCQGPIYPLHEAVLDQPRRRFAA